MTNSEEDQRSNLAEYVHGLLGGFLESFHP